MDFSSWKKVCEDGKTCTLIHPKGHTMTIALKALPAIHREQIKRLKFDEGGKVPAPAQDTSQSDKQARATQMSQGAQQSGGIPDASTLAERLKNAWAKGGKVERREGMSEQGKDVRMANDVKSGKRDSIYKDDEMGEKSMSFAKDEARGRAEMERMTTPKMKGLAKGGEVQYYADDPDVVENDDSDDQPQQPAPPAQAPVTVNVVSPGGAAQPQQPQPNMSMGPATPPPAAPPVVPEQKAPLFPDQTLDTAKAVQQEQSAQSDKAKVEADIAAANVPHIQQRIQAENDRIRNIQNSAIELKNHADALNSDMKDIDVNRFAHNLSNTAKTSTAIGLFLGGLGSAFGGHNYTSEWLDKQTDRDIEAQKQNNENRKTIWGAYHTLYGDQVVANNMTKIALDDRLTQQMQLEALKMGTPMAIAKAKEFGAQKALERNQLLLDTAGRLGTLRSGGGGSGNASPANQPQSGQAEKHPFRQTILTPDADNRIKNIQYALHAKGLDADYGPLMTEYTQAKNADQGLATVNKAFQDLMAINEKGGANLRAALTGVHTVAGVAGAVGSLFGKGQAAALGTEGVLSSMSADSMRRHAAAKSNLLAALSAATKGTNLGSGDLNALVEKNVPVYGDENKTMAEKLNNLRKAITEHINKGYLIKHGLSKP